MQDNNQASILIIDDEKDILDTLMHALNGIGYKIKGLSNSKIALKNICPQTIEEVFLTENAPTDYCQLHRSKNRLQHVFKGVKDFIKKF